ncbi:hypothetical protein DUNSADRAFT_10988 [Dunaliella salina]|uniref:Splicing factor 3A subunit 3 n=1 Tax=Dunaliella salina TaxID=3046 RepID=A0ABQ7GEA8_DUNSA|nr:hypothetical protein DUNSADRAFT_10988 [Dunaliella salina]|eukprot:KAF5832942.1 hypothetical protein DUNSADRAFT_10988 [Dunaliella salina]
MADTLLEQTRALHEDIERTERVITKDFKRDMKLHREKLMQSHRVKRRLEGAEEAAQKLVKIYEDEDGARKEEIAALANNNNPFAAFYDRLKEIREYHRRFPNLDVTEAENDEPLLKEEPHVVFTGEEGFGRYLDLHSHYLALINAKFGKKDLEYYEYVANLPTHTNSIPCVYKAGTAYRNYLQNLLNYLADFHERTQPLYQLQKQLAKVEEETKAAFEAGTLPGWEDRGAGMQAGTAASTSNSGIDLEAFDSPDELESIGGGSLLFQEWEIVAASI